MDAIDRTKDREVEICYQSFYYVAVEGGQGSWIRCRGRLNQKVEDI